jgi:hypothetical protein
VSFTKAASALFHPIAGKRVRVACSKVSFSGQEVASLATIDVVVPARRTIRSKLSGNTLYDFCTVERLKRCSEVVAIPLTKRGEGYLDGRDTTLLLFFVMSSSLASDPSGWRFLTYDEFATRFGGRMKVVELTTPDAAVPSGYVGYWSDGRRHAVVAKQTLLGKRFFLERDADVLSTNVGAFLSNVYGC